MSNKFSYLELLGEVKTGDKPSAVVLPEFADLLNVRSCTIVIPK